MQPITQQENILSKFNITKEPQTGSINNTQETKNVDNKNYSKKIAIAAAAISAVAVAGIIIAKKGGFRASKKPELNNFSSNTQTINKPATILEHCRNIINNFEKNFTKDDAVKYRDERLKINPENYDTLKTLKNSESYLKALSYTVAGEKTQIPNLMAKAPRVVIINGVSASKIKDVSKFLSSALNSEYASIKYHEGFAGEFIDTLEQIGQASKTKFEKVQKRTFLNVDNFSKFLDDLNKKENSSASERFTNFFKKASDENKVSLILNQNEAESLPLELQDKIPLNFDSKINDIDFTKDMELFTSYKRHYSFELTDKLYKNIPVEYNSENHPFDFFKNLIMKNNKKKAVFVEGEDANIVKNVVNSIQACTDAKIEKFNVKETHAQDLLSYLNQVGKESDSRFKRTEHPTILYIDNIKDLLGNNADSKLTEINNIEEFLKTCYENHHILPVYSSKGSKELLPSLIDNDKNMNLKILTSRIDNNAYIKYRDSMTQKFKEDYQGNPEQTQRFIKEYIEHVAGENVGIEYDKGVIPTSMMVFGDKKETDSFVKAIKNALNVHFDEVTYDPNNKDIGIELFSKKAEESEQRYLETGKRTIIELNNFDKLFKSTDTIEDRGQISTCKNILDRLHHTTVLVKSEKDDLDSFEEALADRFKSFGL